MTREEAKIWVTMPHDKLAVIAPHLAKHFDPLCAFANGAEIEFKDSEDSWVLMEYPSFSENEEYRVKQCTEKPAKPWKPKRGEFFFYIDITLRVDEARCACNDFRESLMFASGNFFETRKEAEAARDRVRAVIKGEQVFSKPETVESLDGQPLTDGDKTLLRHLRDIKIVDVFNGETATTIVLGNERDNACFAEAIEYIKEEREAV